MVNLTQPFNVLIDPRVAADGVTVADLQEQFEHNLRMRELVSNVNQLATRVEGSSEQIAHHFRCRRKHAYACDCACSQTAN